MLTNEGQVKILDFGVAKHLPRSDQSSTVDRAGTFAGTPAYMSPEVLLEQPPDGRADIFSLGVVAYEVLTGQHHAYQRRTGQNSGLRCRQALTPLRPELHRRSCRHFCRNPRLHVARGSPGTAARRPRRYL